MKLNIGAGYRQIPGYKSVDIREETDPDYLINLEDDNCLEDIKDNAVDEVIMSHCFEHIKNIHGFMKELYRVCKDSAMVHIISPYWSHYTAVEDPTHIRFMTERSMMYFSKDTISSDGKPFVKDYNFKTMAVQMHPDKKYKDTPIEELKELAGKYINVIESVSYELKVIK